MNVIKSKVMTIANRLVKQGMSRRTAMLKAWVIAKASALRVKVKGTSRRQSELEKLSAFKPSEISVQLKREPHNSFDGNAIAVYAASSTRKVFLHRIFAESRSKRCSTAIRQRRRTQDKGIQYYWRF